MITDLLPDDLLERFRGRAADFDAQNAFFAEDLDDLRASGYLAGPVPADRGGSGLSLADTVRAQRRLAAAAPATALGVNMHLIWVHVARFLHERGFPRLAWVLDEAAAGELFAFGISEAGNDAVLLDARTTAHVAPDGDGVLVHGTKIFTTMAPAWTRLGLHARLERETAGDAEPELVFGFVRREGTAPRTPEEASTGLAEGRITHPALWNTLGMRATQSHTSTLEGVRIAERDIAARIAPFDPTDPLILAIFANFSVLTSAVYAGIADRALALATAAAREPVPVAGGGEAPRLDDPDVAARLTHAVLEHRASLDALEVLARDLDGRAERDDWFLALAAARNRVTDEARQTVETALRVVGARAYAADAELARLSRDVLAGLFHPSSSRALARTVRGVLAG